MGSGSARSILTVCMVLMSGQRYYTPARKVGRWTETAKPATGAWRLARHASICLFALRRKLVRVSRCQSAYAVFWGEIMQILRGLAAAVAASILAGCASQPEIPFDKSISTNIHTIGILTPG